MRGEEDQSITTIIIISTVSRSLKGRGLSFALRLFEMGYGGNRFAIALASHSHSPDPWHGRKDQNCLFEDVPTDIVLYTKQRCRIPGMRSVDDVSLGDPRAVFKAVSMFSLQN